MNAADWLSYQLRFSATEISRDVGLVGKILMKIKLNITSQNSINKKNCVDFHLKSSAL